MSACRTASSGSTSASRPRGRLRREREDHGVGLEGRTVVELDHEAVAGPTEGDCTSPQSRLDPPLERIRQRPHERVHPGCERHERRIRARLLRLRRQPAQHASVRALQLAQLRKRRAQRELLAVATVDPRHERLDEVLVRLAAEPAGDEGRDRLVGVVDGDRNLDLRREPFPSGRREQRAVRKRFEVRRDHPGEALRQRMERAAATHVGARELRAASDELVAQPELLAQAHTTVLS